MRGRSRRNRGAGVKDFPFSIEISRRNLWNYGAFAMVIVEYSGMLGGMLREELGRVVLGKWG